MLRKEVSKYCKANAKVLYLNHLEKRKDEQAKVVHHVSCKECGAKEIHGIRYRCTQRPEYDICQGCEEKHGENSEFSFIKIRKPELAPVHLVCQYGNKIPEGFEVELRRAPVEEKKGDMIKKFEGEDIDKSLSFSNIPIVHPPAQFETKQPVSDLTKSTANACFFMDEVDKLKPNQMRLKENLLKFVQMGLTDFSACVAALEANNNDFEQALACFFNFGFEE